MKPMIKYRGGKSKEIKFFEEYIPSTFNRYTEPFVGGGAVFFYLFSKRLCVRRLERKGRAFRLAAQQNSRDFCGHAGADV